MQVVKNVMMIGMPNLPHVWRRHRKRRGSDRRRGLANGGWAGAVFLVPCYLPVVDVVHDIRTLLDTFKGIVLRVGLDDAQGRDELRLGLEALIGGRIGSVGEVHDCSVQDRVALRAKVEPILRLEAERA